MMTRRNTRTSETGAILPIFAILIIVLLVFAAFAVDLGSAWAQRRQSQTAADAGAMAAALQYLRNAPPDETGIFDLVNEYANANLTGPDLTFDDWVGCVDVDRPADYEALGSGTTAWDYPGAGGSNDVIDCISLKKVNNQPSVLRVRLPNDDVSTSFARVIGIDTIAVSAFAEAEVRTLESSNIIPFSLPANAGIEECLNTPPDGQLPDVAPGCASDSGNFGFLDVNWYGSDDPHATTSRSCGNTPYPNFDSRTPLNLALGIDHNLTAWPNESGPDTDPYYPYAGYDGPPVGTVVPQNDPIVDSCTNALGGSELDPYAVGTKTGNAQLLTAGLFGGPFGLNDDPGRLRQDSPVLPTSAGPVLSGDLLRLDMSNASSTFDVEVDNIGLWEYLDASNSGECARSAFNGLEGRALTDQMHLCLSTADASPIFVEDIIHSPRFAVVPVLNYETQTGDQNWAIITMRPVYLQTTWYACKSNDSTDTTCLFEPTGFADYAPGNPEVSVALTDPNDLAVVGDLGIPPGTSLVTVKANANTTGPGATVDQVEFFVDGSSIGVDTTTPYSVDWDSTEVKDGVVTISATATSNSGSTATDSHTVAVANKKTQDAPDPPASLGKSIFFNPGEGSEAPCLPNKDNDDCIKPTTIEADGLTTLVIKPDWLPDSVKGALGDSSPYEVRLRR